jgi:hypothetical protein
LNASATRNWGLRSNERLLSLPLARSGVIYTTHSKVESAFNPGPRLHPDRVRGRVRVIGMYQNWPHVDLGQGQDSGITVAHVMAIRPLSRVGSKSRVTCLLEGGGGGMSGIACC